METTPVEALQAAGLRVTAGRLAVLGALDVLPHADAERVFREIVAELPTTSIQSVHNILADMSGARIIRRIEPAGSAARYERRIDDNHHHLVCTDCGEITDVDCVVGQAPCLVPSSAADFTVHTAEVTFWGVCATCRAVT